MTDADRDSNPEPIPIYPCDGCGKPIQGEHIMTPRDSWRGFGEVPPEALIHAHNDRCLKRAEAKDKAASSKRR